MTLELADDYDAVQIGVINPFGTAWGLSRVAVAPSASYGSDPTIGAAAYDADGVPLPAMLPVQWGNGGANSVPPGQQVVSLATSAAALAGQTNLLFLDTTSAPALGGARPGAGWFVADGIGCVRSGTKVVAVSQTTVTLSAPVTGHGCGSGLSLYFSTGPFASLSQDVALGSSAGDIGVTFSDWVPMRSLPRTDGGLTLGGAVSGGSVARGTILAATGYTSITLSTPLTGPLAAHAPLLVTYSQSTAAAAGAGSTVLSLRDAAGVRPGQSVSAGSAIAGRTHVASVAGTAVTLDQPIIGAIPTGGAVVFGNRLWSSLPAAAGDTVVSVPSTSALPLLHIRYFTKPGGTISITQPRCMRNGSQDGRPCEAPLGLPPVWASLGGEMGGRLPIDGVDFVARVGAGHGSPHAIGAYPSFFVRFRGRHAGVTLLQCGGYQVSGAVGSVSGEASAGRIGAALATQLNPSIPVSAVSVAAHRSTTSVNDANCTRMIDAVSPNVVLIQDYSDHNMAQVGPYIAEVQAVAEHALAQQAQPIIYLAYVEQAGRLGGVTVARDVNAATTVPLMQGINAIVAGSPTLITGPGVPPGTTATSIPGTWFLTVSQPVTVTAGSVLYLDFKTANSNGRAVTLSDPSFLTTDAAMVSAGGVPAGTTIALTLGSRAATLSAPASLAPGTPLRLMPGRLPSSVLHYTQAAQYFLSATQPWASTWIDAFDAIGADPNTPGLICPGCSTQGAYVNDRGNLIIANLLVPLLAQITGQRAKP